MGERSGGGAPFLSAENHAIVARFKRRLLPPVNSGGTAGAVFCPVGFGDEHTAADHTAFQVLIPENLRFQRPVQRQDRPAEPLTADRERNCLRAGAGVPIVKDNAVAVLKATALPAYQAGRLFLLRRCHAVKGTVRPAFQRRKSFGEMDTDPSFLVVFNRL